MAFGRLLRQLTRPGEGGYARRDASSILRRDVSLWHMSPVDETRWRAWRAGRKWYIVAHLLGSSCWRSATKWNNVEHRARFEPGGMAVAVAGVGCRKTDGPLWAILGHRSMVDVAAWRLRWEIAASGARVGHLGTSVAWGGRRRRGERLDGWCAWRFPRGRYVRWLEVGRSTDPSYPDYYPII
jgi:hypothetical protein